MAEFVIRFITDHSFISEGIRLFSRAPFASHVEIVLDNGYFLGAHLKGGVQVRPPDYCQPTWERWYALPVTPEQLDKIMAFAHAQVGKPYDLRDIEGMVVERNWHSTENWICSELVAAAAEAGGTFMLNVEPEFTYRITPTMLHLSPLLIGHSVPTGRSPSLA